MKLKLTCSAVLLFFFLSVSNLYSQSLHSEKLRLKESSAVLNDSSKTTLTEKSPLLAGSLSFIVPGFALGQFYNGQTEKFFVHAAVSFGCIIGLAISGGTLIQIKMDGQSKGAGLLLAVTAVYIGNWIWSIVDATKSADEINKQIKLQKYRSDFINRIKFGFTVNKNKHINLKFAFEL